MKILIADDFLPIRKSLRRMLENITGITLIAEAGDGNEAAMLVDRLKPDVVILDIQMPGKTGLKILEEIGSNLPATTIIILTNYATPELRKECLSFGADYVLDKTMEFSRVIEIVEQLIRK